MPAPEQRAVPEAGKSRSVRAAIRLLLEQPGLGQECPDTAMFEELRVAGIPLLCELIEILKDNPHLSTAGLLDHMRGRSEGAHLAKLAAQPMDSAEFNCSEEFSGAIQRLIEQRNDQRWKELDAKGLENLTENEKKEWKQLLERRHPMTG